MAFAVLALASTGDAAAAAEAKTAGPSLQGLTLRGSRLTLNLSCTRRVSVQVERRAVRESCPRGAARATFRLTDAQRRRLKAGGTLAVSARVSDARGSAAVPLRLSLPIRGAATARASASGGIWPLYDYGFSGAQAMCIGHGPDGWSGLPGRRQVVIESMFARFGYPTGTMLRWRPWLRVYDNATDTLSWTAGNTTYQHVPGSWRGAAHTFYIANRALFLAPAIEIVGGDWNYVRFQTFGGHAVQAVNDVFPGWCYMAVT